MAELTRLGVADRFRPQMVMGSAPWHYVLDVLGARAVAAERGIEYPELHFKKPNVVGLPYSQRLWHTTAIHSLYARLVRACEGTDARIEEWMTEWGCKIRWGGIVLPDAYGRIVVGARSTSFLVEVDLGTEHLGRLAAKIPDYERLGMLKDVPDAVVFVFASPEREVLARAVLADPGICLATTTLERIERDPLGGIWLPLDSQIRVRLQDIGR